MSRVLTSINLPGGIKSQEGQKRAYVSVTNLGQVANVLAHRLWLAPVKS